MASSTEEVKEFIKVAVNIAMQIRAATNRPLEDEMTLTSFGTGSIPASMMNESSLISYRYCKIGIDRERRRCGECWEEWIRDS
mmetsp:Transcript_25859/g.54655  ORF Transcript_25859/g.54655 Transcript_25859/m.54655 type:complete len:83 (+) Transcript_25859:570-818(+)